ncbi:hypothetical protein NMG60_11031566, partial [Bertholletia excelsa]
MDKRISLQHNCSVAPRPKSSVVSVLISLISDTWAIGPHDIKLIFVGGGSITVACYWGPRASPWRCTTAAAWRTPP